MKKIYNKFRRLTMRTQMIIMYAVAVFIPILIIGIIIMADNLNNLSEYHKGLMRTSNTRAKSVMYEVTSQIYNVSDNITFDMEFIKALSGEYHDEISFRDAIDKFTRIQKNTDDYQAISDIEVYTDQKGVYDYRFIKTITDETLTEKWYKDSCDRYSVVWETLCETGENDGLDNYTLALVRRMPLNITDAKAILVIKLDYNFLRSRLLDDEYNTLVALDDEDRVIVYDDDKDYIGRSDILDDMVMDDPYGAYEGSVNIDNESNMTYATCLQLKSSDPGMFMVTISDTAYSDVNSIRLNMVLIILIAMVLPAVIMGFFIASFSGQVDNMRKEIKKVSLGDYSMSKEFCGCYELDRAYSDLRIMVDNIKEKDAKMYEREIEEQKLLNEQQKMEFQMLASQINPHFLYNTLEMIRMKAITAKDTETATAIKLLGKSMRYVLDNTGTRYSTLAKELEHIEIYLKIQQLRFEDRVNYIIKNDENLRLDKIKILPLLLQPIVENAILHGLEDVEHGGRIIVNICTDSEDEDAINIIISDNGCGMDEKELAKMRKRLIRGANSKKYGIGLYNINQRIKICYGKEYGLSVDSILGKGTTVTAKIKMSV